MLLKLDFSQPTPIYQQIRDQVVRGIAAGALKPGEKLPSVRALAEDAGVNAMTVSKAYQLLKQEGYLHTDRRRGAVICSRAGGAVPRRETVEALGLALSELRLDGVSLEQALALCRSLYENGGAQGGDGV